MTQPQQQADLFDPRATRPAPQRVPGKRRGCKGDCHLERHAGSERVRPHLTCHQCRNLWWEK